MIAYVLTSWTMTEIGRSPLVLVDHPSIERWLDTTNQQMGSETPAPNLVVGRIECDAATLDEIRAGDAAEVIE